MEPEKSSPSAWPAPGSGIYGLLARILTHPQRPTNCTGFELLVSSGTDTNRKKSLVAALVEKLGEAGIDPNDIIVFFLETDRASGSFGGGRFAPPVAFA